MPPLLSIIMATKNENSLYLNKCVESILLQNFQDFNFKIIIDSPEERNIKYFKQLCKKEERIELLFNYDNPGVASSRNMGIKNSMSKYIAIIDSDDFYHENKFALQIEILEKNKNLSLVGSNLFLVDTKNKIIGERFYPELNDQIKKEFLFKMPIANPSLVIRQKDFEEIGLFNEEYKKAEDLELWLRFLSGNKKMYNIQKKLVFYRTPQDENEKRGREHYKNYFFALKKHGNNIWPLYQRIISLTMFYIIQLLPEVFLSYLLNTSIVHKIKKIKRDRI